jgi:hypothetical protein
MTTRQASPGTAPWVAVLEETRSVTSVQWRTRFLACGHVVSVRRNSDLPRAKFCKCFECPPLPAKAKRAKMTPAELGRLGVAARNAKLTPEQRSAAARHGGIAAARNRATWAAMALETT